MEGEEREGERGETQREEIGIETRESGEMGERDMRACPIDTQTP